MARPPLGKLKSIEIRTPTHVDMEDALIHCWRAFRLAGYPRTVLAVALVAAWARGNIRIDPSMKG